MNVFPAKFKFFFEKKGTRHECKYSPDEWNNNVLNWTRSIDNAETLVKYTTSFSFVKEDAAYLKECYNADGVFAKVKFIVEQYDYNSFVYVPYYSGDVDFYSYERDKNKVSIVTTDIGYRASIMANMDTTYEIDMSETYFRVKYDRLRLVNTLKLMSSINIGELYGMFKLYPTIINYSDEIIVPVFQVQDVVETTSIDFKEDLWFCKAERDINITMEVKYNITIKPRSLTTGDPNVSLAIYKGVKAGNMERMEMESHKFTSVNEEFTFSGVYKLDNMALTKNENLYFVIESNPNLLSDYIKTSDEEPIIITITYIARSEDTKIIKGLQFSQLLSKLVEKATGGRYSKIKSDFLKTGEPSQMLVTSGDLIRGIQDGKIKTSLKDFFQAIKSMFGASYTFRVEDGAEILEVEHINYFYDRNTLITEVDDITDIVEKVKDNSIYNKLKVGYEDQTYDEVNGKKEFNTTLEFDINSDHEGKELSLISPYRADMYGIEFTILDYEQKETTDSESDNDVFVIHYKYTVIGALLGLPLNRDYKILNPDSYAGNTAFNVYLSPKRCLLRQIEYIKSLFMFSGNLLKFASSPKDYNVMSTGDITEHADVNLLSYNNLFKPVNFEFETMVPWNLSSLIQEGYRGYIEASDGDEVIRGFIEAVSENPGRDKSQKWKLLSL